MHINNQRDMFKLIASFKNQNPADVVSNMVNEVAQQGNPVMQNLADLIKKGDSAQIEAVVRNIAKERGITNFDNEFKVFKQMFRL
jgi:hypothetical protein